MKQSQPIRILIADDHPVVREGLASLLNRPGEMKVVCESASGRQAVDHFFRHHPDVALIDLRMPEMDGLDVIAAVRKKIPNARIVVLTAYDGDEDIYRALRAGAKAYLLKDASRDELLNSIRAVYEGKDKLSPGVAEKLAGRIRAAELTSRELEVLRLMVAAKSNKEIGALLHVTEGTVKVHVNRILKKLGVRGRTEAITVALQRGLVHFPGTWDCFLERSQSSGIKS